MSQPWERQEGESARAFAAFAAYRDMAPQDRSLTKLAKTRAEPGPGSTLSQVKEWSRKYGWKDRAAAWDDELDRRKRAMFVDERELIFRRQPDLVRKAIDRVAEAIDGADIANVTFSEAVRATDTLVRLERFVFARDAIASVSRQPEPERPPPTQKVASVLRILEEAGVVTLPETSGEPPLEIVDEDE